MTLAEDRVRALVARPALARLLAVLDGEGEEVRVVGGAVRNALIDRPVSDVDCATTALPQEVVRRARSAGFKTVPTGVDHGTVTVLVEGTPFEVTTLRVDVETDGRRARVEYGRDFAADARRRDFTMNALYADREGRIHDPVGGLADLAAGRVRFIGDAAARIREDYLRILRFFRFHADYAKGPLDPEGLAATVRERDGLDQLSRERVRTELLKLIAARRAVETVAALADAGLLQRILGDVGELGRLARVAEAEARAGSARDPLLRLAALAVRTAENAEALKERLRLSNAEYRRLAAIGRLLPHLHGSGEALDARAVRRLAVGHGLLALSDTLAILDGEPLPRLTPEGSALLARFRQGAEAPPVFPLGGADVVATGVPKGPRVGRILAEAEARWLDADCPRDRAVLAGILAEAIAAVTGKTGHKAAG
ncbi:CCA tRNA nucleotidyltransferase [Chelatococcus sp. SYSU_G07232]|uniref:CCA tRNA nucleotidyltransferase n=1 Tax=Chelatococcus albus TaxID=3047466 RepID=A0ABT7AJP3_9HYPH|nr:CCA tRNA nucleotidyltransferase [Chelatococcus sp. SYSU_G07232]MDJ1159325.1 CCA tRNA nucleotidyltransferase [Chelatococcus sp. SYSU_G07232]